MDDQDQCRSLHLGAAHSIGSPGLWRQQQEFCPTLPDGFQGSQELFCRNTKVWQIGKFPFLTPKQRINIFFQFDQSSSNPSPQSPPSKKQKKKSLRHFKLFLRVPEIFKKVKEDASTGQSEAGRHTHLRTPLKEILEAAGLSPLPFKQVKCKFRFETLSLANQKEVFTCHWPSHQ